MVNYRLFRYLIAHLHGAKILFLKEIKSREVQHKVMLLLNICIESYILLNIEFLLKPLLPEDENTFA